MNMFELVWGAFALIGMIAGGVVGYDSWGTWGAVGGVPVGLGVGLCAYLLLVLVVYAVIMAMPDRQDGSPPTRDAADSDAQSAA